MEYDLAFIWAGLIAFAVLTYVILDGFDATEECAQVTCLYHQVNWWIERMIVSSRGRDAGHGRGVERSARRWERDVIFTRVSHHATGRGAASAYAVIAGAGSHLGAGAHREGGEDTEGTQGT